MLRIKAMSDKVIDGQGLFWEHCGRLLIEELHSSSLIFSTGVQKKPVVMTLKRLIDIVGSLSGLLLLAPLYLLIAVFIKCDSPGLGLRRAARSAACG